MTFSTLTEFYLGQVKDNSGRTIEQIWEYNDHLLEITHDYIQWLFPTKTRSQFNVTAPLLDDQVIAEFRSNEELQRRLLRSFQRMLKFYGFLINEDHGLVNIIKTSEFPEKKKNWLTLGNHNYLRITRILTSLNLLGLETFSRAFLDCLLQVYSEESAVIGLSTQRYWKSTHFAEEILGKPAMLQKIGVIGDIHAEAVYLQAALEFLRDLPFDALLCTGDVVDGAGDVNTCCQLLADNAVQTVRGNHDDWFLEGQFRDLPDATPIAGIEPDWKEYLSTLPLVREFETPKGLLLLCHGIGYDTMRKVLPDDSGYALESNFELHALIRSGRYRWMVNGHTHQRMVRTIDGLTIVNAGTLLHHHDPGFLTIDFEKGSIQFYEVNPIRKSETISLNRT
jgi:predicted phosphodiesterase